MFDAVTTAPAASAPVPAASRVRIVHAGGTLDVELLPGSSTVLDLTASKGGRGGATRVLGFLGVVALVAGVGWAASTLLPPRAPAPTVAGIAPWQPRSQAAPSAAWPTLPGPLEAAPQESTPAAPVPPTPVPSTPAARDPFGLVQQ